MRVPSSRRSPAGQGQEPKRRSPLLSSRMDPYAEERALSLAYQDLHLDTPVGAIDPYARKGPYPPVYPSAKKRCW